jgi:hypothetical protein
MFFANCPAALASGFPLFASAKNAYGSAGRTVFRLLAVDPEGLYSQLDRSVPDISGGSGLLSVSLNLWVLRVLQIQRTNSATNVTDFMVGQDVIPVP